MNISELGANEAMLESLADVTLPMTGGYKVLDRSEIIEIVLKKWMEELKL